MSLAPALPRSLPANLEAQCYELARTRQLARAWAETLPEPRHRHMAAMFTRVAIDTYQAEARPRAELSALFAKPYGWLDRTVAELAQTLKRKPVEEKIFKLWVEHFYPGFTRPDPLRDCQSASLELLSVIGGVGLLPIGG